MANLPPINSVVKVIKTVADQNPKLGQTGTVIQHSVHGMVCVHFPDMPPVQGIFFQSTSFTNHRVIVKIMPRKSTHPTPTDNSSLCLQYLRRCGGSARLCTINFSLSVIQTLVNQRKVKITNTGAGFYVQLEDIK